MERTPEIIGEAVMDVLREPRYRQNAMRLRREMQALPGPGQAVGLLERLVLEKAPIIDTGRAQEFRTNGWPV